MEEQDDVKEDEMGTKRTLWRVVDEVDKEDYSRILRSAAGRDSVRTLVAQSGAGSIQGTVPDSTGAVIPAASIDVVNVATGVKTDTKSNGVGFYQVPELFTGTYQVAVNASGMKTYTTSIQLLVAQNAVINPVLTAGAITQQVVVAGDTVQLTTTDNGSISSTLENARINQLPMNGRFLTNLLSTHAWVGKRWKDIDGLMPSAVIYTVDGVSTQDNLRGGLYYGSGGSQLIDPDSVQEVRMEALNAGAEYATPATAIITTNLEPTQCTVPPSRRRAITPLVLPNPGRIPLTIPLPIWYGTNLALLRGAQLFCPISITGKTSLSGFSHTSASPWHRRFPL